MNPDQIHKNDWWLLPALWFYALPLHSAVTAVIPGARNVREVSENAKLLQTKIPAPFWADLKSAALIP